MTTPPLPVESREVLRERFARSLYFAAEGLRPESWFLPENDAHWERWKNDGHDISPSPLAVADALIAAFPALQSPSPQSEGEPGRIAELEREIAMLEKQDAQPFKSPIANRGPRIARCRAELSRLRNEQPKGVFVCQDCHGMGHEPFNGPICKRCNGSGLTSPAPSPGAQDVRELITELRDWPATRRGDAMSASFVSDLMRRAAHALAQSDAQPVAQSQGGEAVAVGEPVAWQYRFKQGGWSGWHVETLRSEVELNIALQQKLDWFEEYEIRPLYTSPPASPDGAVREALEAKHYAEGFADGKKAALTVPPQPGLIEAAELAEQYPDIPSLVDFAKQLRTRAASDRSKHHERT